MIKIVAMGQSDKHNISPLPSDPKLKAKKSVQQILIIVNASLGGNSVYDWAIIYLLRL